MYCILVTGVPASGKSTLAKALSARLNLPCLSKDDIKELLFDDVGFSSRAQKVALGTAAMDMMYYAARQLLRCGMPFILENNFEHASREGLDALLREFDCTAITVLLTGDLHILYDRFVQRNLSPDRHRGHVVNDRYPESGEPKPVTPLPYEQFVRGVTSRGMADFAANGPRIVIDMTHPETVDVDALAEQLKALMQ